jgi:hypothetical protein
MIGTWWTSRKVGFIAAAMTLAGAAAFLWIAVAYPKPVSVTELGAEWQCHRTAFVWTSCNRVRQTETGTVAQSARKDTPCPQRRGLNG